MFGEMLGGRAALLNNRDCMGNLEKDLWESRIKPEGWREIAQKAGRWFRWADDGMAAYIHNMRNCRDAENSSCNTDC